MTKRNVVENKEIHTVFFAQDEEANRNKIFSARLSNGAKLLHIHTPGTLKTSFGIMIEGAGSAAECVGKYPFGTAHFVEHYKARTSEKFPNCSNEIERHGGSHSAWTSYGYVMYCCEFPINHWQVGLNVLCDSVCSFGLARQVIENQEAIILEENLDLNEETPALAFLKNSLYLVYQAHPYFHSTTNSHDAPTIITPADLIRFELSKYNAAATTIVFVGDVPPAVARNQVEELFTLPSHVIDADRPPVFGGGVSYIDKPSDSVRCRIVTPFAEHKDITHITQREVLSTIVGTLLHKALRNAGGIYSSSSCINQHKVFSYFSHYHRTSLPKVETNLKMIRKTMKELAASGNPTAIRAHQIRTLMNAPDWFYPGISSTRDILTGLTTGSGAASPQLKKEIALGLTNDDLKVFAQELLASPYAVCLQGRTDKLPKAERVQALMQG